MITLMKVTYQQRGEQRWQLRPVGDSIAWRTWRPRTMRARGVVHRYPTEGCHGAPLERECSCVRNPKPYVQAPWCCLCNGTGRVRLDAPERRDGP